MSDPHPILPQRTRELITEVVKLVGVPYRYGGRDTRTGLDCLTCCAVVYGILGREFPLPADYGVDRIDAQAFIDWADNWQACGPGDNWPVVDMSPSHAGVLLPGAPGRVLHCQRGKGVAITKLHRLGTIVRGYWELRP